jgi:hypothetical protein
LDNLELGLSALQYLDENYLGLEAVDQHGMDEIQIDGWIDGWLAVCGLRLGYGWMACRTERMSMYVAPCSGAKE